MVRAAPAMGQPFFLPSAADIKPAVENQTAKKQKQLLKTMSQNSDHTSRHF